MPAKPRVFVARRIPAVGLDLIAPHCAADVWPDLLPPPAAVLRDQVRDCEGLISLLTDRVDDELLAAAPKLRVVSNFAVGVNNIDLAAAARRGVRVGNTPGVLTEATADIAVTLLLAAARRLGESATDAKAGRWKTWDPLGWLGQDLVGRTLGIVGMGRIGRAVARRARAFRMPVLYTSRTRLDRPEEHELGIEPRTLPELMAESDVVTLHCPLTDATRGLIGAGMLARMRDGSCLINAARGALVDEPALAAELRSGRIQAGLDVFWHEPAWPQALSDLPNVVLTPHIATATAPTRFAMTRVLVDNVLAFRAGRPLVTPVRP
jgi:glyoxylate reductase